VTYEFDEGANKKIMVFEVRHWMTNNEAGIGGKKGGNCVGNTFYGSKGYLAVDGYNTYKTFLGREQQPGPERSQGGSNWVNFIDVVRSRDRSIQNNDIAEGVISCDLMHLGNIAYRLGRTIRFDPVNLKTVGDDEAARMFTRKYRAPYVVPEKV
jgi:hypothetical protein